MPAGEGSPHRPGTFDGPVDPSFVGAVLALLATTRPGELLTYGEVAEETGYPGAARAVGTALRRHGSDAPWWRVVTATGRLVPGLEQQHAVHLEAEGIACRDGAVAHMRAQGARSRQRGGRDARATGADPL